MTRILLVDDHLMFATAIRFLLQSLAPEVDAVPVGSVQAALEQLDDDDGFDLVLLDYIMPDVDGLAGLAQIKVRHATINVAILSGSSDPISVRKALAMGAMGWVPKTMPGSSLLQAIRLMATGQKFFPPELLDDRPEPGLSERETQVADLLAMGLSDKQIADRLSIQLGTVKVHVKRVLKKANAANRTRFALMYQGR